MGGNRFVNTFSASVSPSPLLERPMRSLYRRISHFVEPIYIPFTITGSLWGKQREDLLRFWKALHMMLAARSLSMRYSRLHSAGDGTSLPSPPTRRFWNFFWRYCATCSVSLVIARTCALPNMKGDAKLCCVVITTGSRLGR